MSSPLLTVESPWCLSNEGMNGGMNEQWVTTPFSAAPGSREGAEKASCQARSGQHVLFWVQQRCPSYPSPQGLGVTLKWMALLPRTRPRDSPAHWGFPSLWLQKVGGWRENPCGFHG